MKRDYYEVLEVKKDASIEEIKKAYKTKAKEHHPDKGGDEEKFKEITEAYEHLSDPDKRAKYDMFGHNAKQRTQFHQYRHHRSVRKGTNMVLTIKLTIEEIYTGVKKKFKYKRDDTCDDCKGHGGLDMRTCSGCGGSGVMVHTINTPIGQINQAFTCTACGGEGETYDNICVTCKGSGTKTVEETIDVEVPSGVQEGMTFVMENKGNFAKNGLHGDLHINIMELAHKTFVRNGNNLKINLKLLYPQLVLGDKVEINTIEGGKIRVAVPERSSVGTNLRIPNKGLKTFNKEGDRGELIIVLDIHIPTIISEEEKKLIEKLKEMTKKVATNETN